MCMRASCTTGSPPASAPLLNLQLRAIETTDIEQRLVKVEKQIAAKEAKEARQGNGRRKTVDFRPRDQ